MATIKKFEDITAWQQARILSKNIYSITNAKPFSSDFDLRSQIRRASGSVMDNIAEGFERSGNKEFIHFLLIAKASNGEVRSQLYRAADRKHLTSENFDDLKLKSEIISRKITAFIKYLKESDKKGFRYE